MTYKEKLLDPRWQKKRLSIFERDAFTCRICRSQDKTLHVHHRTYRKDTEPWEYPDNLLITMCLDCHKEEEAYKAYFKQGIELLVSNHLFYKDLVTKELKSPFFDEEFFNENFL
jgi:5-methylcytosine-specific restriction endonuclease McrA